MQSPDLRCMGESDAHKDTKLSQSGQQLCLGIEGLLTQQSSPPESFASKPTSTSPLGFGWISGIRQACVAVPDHAKTRVVSYFAQACPK